MLPLAAQVGEPEVDGAHVVRPDLLENGCGIRHGHTPDLAAAIFARARRGRNGAGRPTHPPAMVLGGGRQGTRN